MSKSPKSDPSSGTAALATPTDLSNKSTQAVATELNKLVADAFALYVKTKNFHWHMSGPHFRDYHVMLDVRPTKSSRRSIRLPSACAS